MDASSCEMNESDLQLANLDLDTLISDFGQRKTNDFLSENSNSSSSLQPPAQTDNALLVCDDSGLTSFSSSSTLPESKSPLCLTRKRTVESRGDADNDSEFRKCASTFQPLHSKASFTKTAILGGHLKQQDPVEKESFLFNLKATMRDNSFMPNSLSNTQQSSMMNESQDDQTDKLFNHSNLGVDSQRLARILDVADQLRVNSSTKRVELAANAAPPLFHGVPDSVRSLLSKERKITKLYDWQAECLSLEAVQRRENLLYVLPTNGGKTLVAEFIMLRTLLVHRQNVIFVLPFVAIVQEKIRSLTPFADALDFFLEEYAGGRGRLPPTRHHKPSLYIATIEKAHALLNSLIEAQRTEELGLLVVDEIHLLGESGTRGATLESLITKLRLVNSQLKVQTDSKQSKESRIVQIVGMTATLANIDEIASFLGAVTYKNAFRPTEIREFVKVTDSLYRIELSPNANAVAVRRPLNPVRRTVNIAAAHNQLRFEKVVHHTYSSKADADRDVDRIVPLVAEVVPQHSCLIFCASKRACENLALLLADLLPRSKMGNDRDTCAKQRLDLLKEMQLDSNGSVCPILKRTVPFGVAYHHGGLTHDERRVLEDAFVAADGTLPVLVCTSTLAAGVNLPARRVIIRSPFVATEFLTLSRYRQIIGRAGRTGFETVGESIAIVSEKHLDQFVAMVSSSTEDCISQLTIDNYVCLYNLVLSLLGLKLVSSYNELEAALDLTLYAVQARSARRSVDGGTNKLASLRSTLASILMQLSNEHFIRVCDNQMSKENAANKETEAPLVEQQPIRRCSVEDSSFECTKLGKASFKSGVSLRFAAVLQESLTQALRGLVLDNDLHMLYVLTPLDDVELLHQNFDVNETPFWQLLLTRLHAVLNDASLCDHVQRVCDGIGIREQLVLRRAHGLGYNMTAPGPKAGGDAESASARKRGQDDLFPYKRLFLTLMLFELWRGKSIFQVAGCFSTSRGYVQSLLASSASFASCVSRFVEEFDEFEPFKKLLPDFARRLTFCTNQELIPLMQLAGVRQARALQLFRSGIRTVEDLAKLSVGDLLAKRIENLSRRAAKQIIEAARLHLKQEAEELKEKAADILLCVGIDERTTSSGAAVQEPKLAD